MIVVLPIVVTMLVILVLAALVVVYAAYPHRGEDLPRASWLSDLMRKGARSIPTISSDEDLHLRR